MERAWRVFGRRFWKFWVEIIFDFGISRHRKVMGFTDRERERERERERRVNIEQY